MMFSHHNLVSGNNFTFPWKKRSSASMLHSSSEASCSWLLSDEQVNPSFFNEAHNCDAAPSISVNSHSNFLRLDSTGEVVQEGSVPFNSNTVLNSLLHHQENVRKSVNMPNYPQSREIGFGQRYSQHRHKNHHHRNWTKPKDRPKVGNSHDGYPFFQFAMAAAPSEVSVKFYGYHGDTQVLNMDQLFPQFRNTWSRLNPGGTNLQLPATNERGVMNKGSRKTEMGLCDALGKMSFSACQDVGEVSSVAETISVSSQQMGSQDSGFFETLPHLEDGLSPISPQMNTTSDGDEDNLSHEQKSDIEYVDCPGSVQVQEAFNDYSMANKTLLDNTENRTTSSSPFLMSVINTDEDDDSDSEIEVSDDISFFDSDDSDMDESGDPCSRSSELELLACFFPDDPYNPLNFNLSCSKNCAPKRPMPVADADDDIGHLSDTSCARKRVRFVSDSELAEVHEEESSLADDYQEARCGPWEEFARGRERFKRRVTELEPILAPCLTDVHRQQMWDLIHS